MCKCVWSGVSIISFLLRPPFSQACWCNIWMVLNWKHLRRYFFISLSIGQPCSIFILSCCKGIYGLSSGRASKIFSFDLFTTRDFCLHGPFEALCLTHVSLVQYLLLIINLQYLHSCQKFRPRWLDNLTWIQSWCFK